MHHDTTVPEVVLRQFPSDCQPCRVKNVGQAGFSGAEFFQLDTRRGLLCLRAWPHAHPHADRLRCIHAVLQFASGKGCRRFPLPIATIAGDTFVAHHGRLWEIAPWLPGVPLTREEITPAKVCAAMELLAEFHLATLGFEHAECGFSPSRVVTERLKLARAITPDLVSECRAALATIESGWRKPLAELLDRAASSASDLAHSLAAHANVSIPRQPCISDVWRENVLFDNGSIVGLVDFGAMRIDSVAVDVARLLSSLALGSAQLWQQGLAAYESSRMLSAAERDLVRVFDQGLAVLAGWNWARWILLEQRVFPCVHRVRARLEELAALPLARQPIPV